MNGQSEHLSNAQIENYGEQVPGSSGDQPKEEQWVDAHLDGCSDCRSRVLNFHRSHFGLLSDSASSTSGSADLEAGGANPGGKTVNSNRMTPASGIAQSAGEMQPHGTQAAREFAGQTSVRPGQETARPVNTVATPDCPSADELRQLAAGLLQPALAGKLFRHVATCDHCGPLLKAYTEDFSEDFSPEEQAVLASLQSSSLSWQQQTAKKMLQAAAVGAEKTDAAKARTTRINIDGASAANSNSSKSAANAIAPKPVKNPFFWKWLPVPAAAAVTVSVCLIIALGSAGVWYAQRDTPEKTEQQLAQTYTEKRTMDLRWPGAEWGRNHATRGNDANQSLRGSLPWTTAILALSKHHTSGSANQDWLLPRAEAEILEGRVDAAISDLNQALAQGQRSSSLMLFLGIAYAQKGDDDSLKKALEFFNNADQQQPGNPVVLFNRALIYERLNQPAKAVADLNSLLKTEQNNDWANEARTRLKELESIK